MPIPGIVFFTLFTLFFCTSMYFIVLIPLKQTLMFDFSIFIMWKWKSAPTDMFLFLLVIHSLRLSLQKLYFSKIYQHKISDIMTYFIWFIFIQKKRDSLVEISFHSPLAAGPLDVAIRIKFLVELMMIYIILNSLN